MSPQWRIPLLTLVAGFALGAAFGRLCLGDMDRPPRFMGDTGKVLDHFSRKLSLNGDQRDKISKILEIQKPKFESLRSECRPKFDALRNETGQQIRTVLTPEQQAKFDAMQKDWQARQEKFRDRR